MPCDRNRYVAYDRNLKPWIQLPIKKVIDSSQLDLNTNFPSQKEIRFEHRFANTIGSN